MIEIKSIADFENVLKLEKTIVFIYFEWSGQARVSKNVVINWESQTKSAIPLFEINPEDSDEFNKWVCDNKIHGHGYGSLVWLKKGEILDFEKYAAEFGISKLEEKTFEVFHIE
jgi:hypothetical protein